MSAGRAERAQEPADESSDTVAEAVAIAHRVAMLAETDPGAPLIVATRAALEVADSRRADRRDRRVADWEIHGGDNAWWARWAERWMPYAELAALRATPGTTGLDGLNGDQIGSGVDGDGGAW